MAQNDTSRTLSRMQTEVHTWVSQFTVGYFPPLLNLARLLEESGELARVLAHRAGKTPKPSEPEGELAEELGDVLFVLVCLANQHGLELNTLFDGVMRKLNTRDAQRFERRDAVPGADAASQTLDLHPQALTNEAAAPR